jgi:hypothetical protein
MLASPAMPRLPCNAKSHHAIDTHTALGRAEHFSIATSANPSLPMAAVRSAARPAGDISTERISIFSTLSNYEQ